MRGKYGQVIVCRIPYFEVPYLLLLLPPRFYDRVSGSLSLLLLPPSPPLISQTDQLQQSQERRKKEDIMEKGGEGGDS